jgi:hypothetical protein
VELERVIKIECCAETWSGDPPGNARLGMSEAGGYNTCFMSELLANEFEYNQNTIGCDCLSVCTVTTPVPLRFQAMRMRQAFQNGKNKITPLYQVSPRRVQKKSSREMEQRQKQLQKEGSNPLLMTRGRFERPTFRRLRVGSGI